MVAAPTWLLAEGKSKGEAEAATDPAAGDVSAV